MVTAGGRGRPPRESNDGSGASRGSALQSRSGRREGRWPGRGDAAGPGGRRLPGAVLRLWASLRPCSDKFPNSVHRQSSCLQLCFRDVFPQCKLCSRPSKFSRCRSWGWFLTCPLLCIDRCVALRPYDHAATSSGNFQQCDSGGASIQFIDKVGASLWTETGTLGLWWFHRCSSRTWCSATAGTGTSTRPSMCR